MKLSVEDLDFTIFLLLLFLFSLIIIEDHFIQEGEYMKFLKWNSLKLTLVSALILIGHQAHSIVELRGSYTLLSSSPDLVSLYTGAASAVPSVTPTVGLGADIIVSLPLVPVGFGLRYENQAIDASTSTLKFETSFTRTSLILNYRLIDTLLFVGPIFTYGLSDSTSLKFTTTGGTPVSNYTAGSTSSYSIGLEAGVKLLTFLVGGEVGYLDYRWKDSRDSVGTGGTKDINMSGSYIKVLFGFKI